MAERLQRSQVRAEETWNLADIYSDAAAWAADAALVAADLRDVAAFRGRLSEGSAVLLACLRCHDRLINRLHRLRRYAYFSLAMDGGAPQSQAFSEQGSVAAGAQADCSFLKPEIVALGSETIATFLHNEPELGAFRPLLQEAERESEHLLHPETEAALAAFGAARHAPQQHWNMATAVDLHCAAVVDASGEPAPVGIAAYGSVLAQSPDRSLRRDAYQSLVTGLNGLKAMLATALSTHIAQNVVMARVRGYASASEMILGQQRVPRALYDQVLDVVHEEIAPHVRRLMRLRARILGLEQLQRYDMEAPLDPHYQPQTTFAESAALIQETLRLFGDEYGAILEAAFSARWIDRADNVGKRSGAFCWPVAGVHPYVFISWKNTLRSAFTLAHDGSRRPLRTDPAASTAQYLFSGIRNPDCRSAVYGKRTAPGRPSVAWRNGTALSPLAGTAVAEHVLAQHGHAYAGGSLRAPPLRACGSRIPTDRRHDHGGARRCVRALLRRHCGRRSRCAFVLVTAAAFLHEPVSVFLFSRPGTCLLRGLGHARRGSIRDRALAAHVEAGNHSATTGTGKYRRNRPRQRGDIATRGGVFRLIGGPAQRCVRRVRCYGRVRNQGEFPSPWFRTPNAAQFQRCSPALVSARRKW